MSYYTIAALIIGLIFGWLLHALLHKPGKDGTLWVNTTNPEKDIYSIEFNIPLSQIEDRQIFVLQVKSH